ncbi:hypothetical protein ONZ51_g11319 [Trametes cubensis]|uniref:MYND-type domain-containing protein n=1 Tax=Trametes cubensis TaxID=1111947 RepID=A0AAD7TKD7_9APHY|nr:hypothetical protein ONZ51_g11319 [Trametes cubensis]
MNSSRALIPILYCARPGCHARACDVDIVCCRCRTTYYCSRKHQIADVEQHKQHCTNPPRERTVDESPRHIQSEVSKVNMVLFPANGLPPMVITMDCYAWMSPIYHGLREEFVDLQTLLKANTIFCYAVGSARPSASRSTRLYLARGDLPSGGPMNMCVRRYVSERDSSTWTGDVVGFRCREPTTKYLQYLDVNQDDIPMFVTHLKHFGLSRTSTTPNIPTLQLCQSYASSFTADFTRHRDECRPSLTPLSSSSSSSSTLDDGKLLSVLLFPADEDSPRIIQTECRVEDDDDDPRKKVHMIDFGALLQAQNAERSFHLPVGHIQGSAPPTRLYLAVPEDYAANDAQPNRAVARLMGDYPLPLKGTLIGYRAREPAQDWTQFVDVSLEDIPAYAAFLRARALPGPLVTWRHIKRYTSGTPNTLQAKFEGAVRLDSMSPADPPARTLQLHHSVQVQTDPQQPPKEDDAPAGPINNVYDQLDRLQVDFEQQKAAIRAIVAEELLRATLTTLAVAAGACAAGACIVLPILAFCGMLFSAVDGTVGALLARL